MSRVDEAVVQAAMNAYDRLYQAHCQALGMYVDMSYEAGRPSTRYKPRLFIDGDQWCALYGESLQNGVAGFGKSPDAAYAAFDEEWTKPLPVSAREKGTDE